MPKRKASSSSTSSEPEGSILWQTDSRMIPSEPKVETKETGARDKHQSKKKHYSPSFQKSKEMPKSAWEDQIFNQAKNTSRLGNIINHAGPGASSRTTQQEVERTAQSQFEFQGLGIPSLPVMPHGDPVARQSYRNRHIVPLPVCEDIAVDTIQPYVIDNAQTQFSNSPQSQPSAPGALNTVPSFTYAFYRPGPDADCYTQACDATASSSTTAYNHDPNFDMDL